MAWPIIFPWNQNQPNLHFSTVALSQLLRTQTRFDAVGLHDGAQFEGYANQNRQQIKFVQGWNENTHDVMRIQGEHHAVAAEFCVRWRDAMEQWGRLANAALRASSFVMWLWGQRQSGQTMMYTIQRHASKSQESVFGHFSSKCSVYQTKGFDSFC